MAETETRVNPLREGLQVARTPTPCTIVIFGITGDLANRKLMPALYQLTRDRFLPAGFSVVGVARRPKTDDQIRDEIRDSVGKFSRSGEVQPLVWDSFAQGIYYVQSQFPDRAGYERLKEKLDRIDQERGTQGNRLFYLATPPEFYPVIVENLGAVGLAQSAGWTRLIVEKPFGHDLESAKTLNTKIHDVFHENQVYRIDHYLGKETVQNIYVFRFANGIFEPIWNRRYIDHVQITVAESIGIEGRADYYEGAGALRDIIQNHMLQLVAHVAMEPPATFDPNSVRDEKSKVLRAIRVLEPNEAPQFAVRGQYDQGIVGSELVPSYRQEPDVSPTSNTETFVALKLEIDNWRWAGIPFYLRTGKRLSKRITEIAIQFRMPPLMLFGRGAGNIVDPNVLAINVQPDEGISLRFESKVPGQDNRMRPVTMDFRYGTAFGVPAPEAYERLLLDAMLGDPMLFTRRDEVEAQWGYVMPILEYWGKNQAEFPNYRSGTWGPEAADQLIQRDGRRWRRL